MFAIFIIATIEKTVSTLNVIPDLNPLRTDRVVYASMGTHPWDVCWMGIGWDNLENGWAEILIKWNLKSRSTTIVVGEYRSFPKRYRLLTLRAYSCTGQAGNLHHGLRKWTIDTQNQTKHRNRKTEWKTKLFCKFILIFVSVSYTHLTLPTNSRV